MVKRRYTMKTWIRCVRYRFIGWLTARGWRKPDFYDRLESETLPPGQWF
jgi:hypothetical protein